MSFNLKTKVRSGYLMAFVLLVVSYILIFYTIQKLVKGTRAISHTYSVLHAMEALRGEMAEAETGVRGYVITGEERFLEPYKAALPKIPALYKELRTITTDNAEHQAKLDILDQLISRKLSIMASGIKMYQDAGLKTIPAMRANRESSKSAMDSIRLLLGQMQESEHKLMDTRRSALTGAFNSTDVIAITSLVIAIVTILYSVIVFNRENKAKEQASVQAATYQQELEDTVKELKKVNEELRELKQIEKFAATGRIARTIAHEVRNPLTNISLATEQLGENNSQTEESVLLLDMIRRNAGRINQLVSDLLHSTRFAQLDFVKMDINQVIDETLEMAQDRIGLNDIVVQKNYSTPACTVAVDAEKLKLALLNIIVNAIEAMENGKGVLKISTRNENDQCIIEIADNGSGMDEDTLQKVFEPYFTNKMKGTGLGLTNTQNIIFNHRGNITVKSKPGGGTSFFVQLNLDSVTA